MGPGLSTYGVRGDALRCLVETSSTVLFPACTVESRGGLYSRVVSGRSCPLSDVEGRLWQTGRGLPVGITRTASYLEVTGFPTLFTDGFCSLLQVGIPDRGVKVQRRFFNSLKLFQIQ